MPPKHSSNPTLVQAPGDYHPFGVLSVLLQEDEEVLWHWSHQENKSYVSGYSIRKTKEENTPKLKKNW